MTRPRLPVTARPCTEAILAEIGDDAGWGQDYRLELLCRFIDQLGQEDPEADLNTFLQAAQTEDEELAEEVRSWEDASDEDLEAFEAGKDIE